MIVRINDKVDRALRLALDSVPHVEKDQIASSLDKLDELERKEALSLVLIITRLPVIVASEALAVYAPREMGKWDYLNQIESAIEVASALETSVLPAAITRAYFRTPDETD